MSLKLAVITGLFNDVPCEITVTPHDSEGIIDADLVTLHLAGGPLSVSVDDLVAVREALMKSRAPEMPAPPKPDEPEKETWDEAIRGAASEDHGP